MIKSIKDAETERIYHRQWSRKLTGDIQQIALRKLRMLNNAISLKDLSCPPANRLENSAVNVLGSIASESMIGGGFVLNGLKTVPTTLRSLIITRKMVLK